MLIQFCNFTLGLVMDNQTASKSRGENFDAQEKALLMEIQKQYHEIIENKKTDAVSTKRKNEAWEDIMRKFNSSTIKGERSTKQLKAGWKRMKIAAKKNAADKRREVRATGGGPYNPELDNDRISAKIQEMIPAQINSLDNPYDDDVVIMTSVNDDLKNNSNIESSPNTITLLEFVKETEEQGNEAGKTTAWKALDFKTPKKISEEKEKPTSSGGKKRRRELIEDERLNRQKEHELKMELLREERDFLREEHKIKMEYWDLMVKKLKFEM